jgi:predicted lipoprotein
MEANMSVAGIASAGLSQLASIHRNYQQVQGEFKQLGQDLQAGNLTGAQTDFVTLSQSVATQLAGNSPAAKALNSVGQALQSGNLSAAQQAFASLPSHMVGPCAVPHHAHAGSASSPQNSFSQSLSQIGQALQSGNLTAAQQAFSAMQQGWQQMESDGGASTSGGTALPSVTSGLNVAA